MKSTVMGILLGAGLALAVPGAFSAPQPVSAQVKVPAAVEGGMVVLSAPLADGGQQLVVVDPLERVVCVYHIGAKNGEVVLKSIRNIHWDLRMSQFNGVSPLPQEIRSLVEQR